MGDSVFRKRRFPATNRERRSRWSLFPSFSASGSVLWTVFGWTLGKSFIGAVRFFIRRTPFRLTEWLRLIFHFFHVWFTDGGPKGLCKAPLDSCKLFELSFRSHLNCRSRWSLVLRLALCRLEPKLPFIEPPTSGGFSWPKATGVQHLAGWLVRRGGRLLRRILRRNFAESARLAPQ